MARPTFDAEPASSRDPARLTRFTARRIKPISYDDVDHPQTPQAEIDVCLECPLPDCRRRGCPLAQRGLAKWTT